MARDYTKYNVEGLGENLNKRQLVFTVVKDYVEKNNPSFEDLQKAFPDEVHGGNPDKFGLIRKEAEAKNHRYFNMREPLKIKQGVHVVVMNQWGENINDFIAASEKLGYQVSSIDNGSVSNMLEQNNSPVSIEFGVYSDEGGALELRFNHDFEFISLNGKADSEDYENILNNQDILIYCKNLIQNLDNYLLENGAYYKLRILKIDDFDLSCIWDIDGDDYDAEALPIVDLKHFFKIETKEELLDDLEDIISDFDSDTMTSLEYLNSLRVEK